METTPAGPSRRQVYDDLYDQLALHHDLEHADRMAHALLRVESDGKDLVGLVDDHQRAVYYSTTGHSLKGYAFDEHGVREADVDSVWRLLSDAASWVDAHQEELDWIHPHYRWVLDLETGADEWGVEA